MAESIGPQPGRGPVRITVGVLALQGAFSEHAQLLRRAFALLSPPASIASTTGTAAQGLEWRCEEVRTPAELARCDALIIPGGESTAISLVAAASGLLDPLRAFVKIDRKPTWGTCAGLILLAEAANRTKKGGQELIGGLDVRVNRNHFGRQVESFETGLDLGFLRQVSESESGSESSAPLVPFRGVFIRAPIVERILPARQGIQDAEEKKPDTIVAPSRPADASPAAWSSQPAQVQVMATLPGRNRLAKLDLDSSSAIESDGLQHTDDIVAVRQRNVFATSFHPELTDDPRIHVWWLQQVLHMTTAKSDPHVQ